MSKTQRVYGMDFPASSSKVEIELACYRHNKHYRKNGGNVWPAEEHFINAVRMLYTNEQLTWNAWTEDHAINFVRDEFAVIWGPGAASKSNDFGCFCVVDWWADPENTYTAVCSTTAPMLQKRIWEAILRYHGYHKKNAPGFHKRSITAITLDKDESNDESIKAGIHGFAVLSGTKDESEANIVGVHLPRVRLLVDEMQSTRRSAVDARHNLSKGVEDFKFFGLCNPTSFLNIAGEYSEPIDGWETVSVETESWDTRWGRCYHYDGHKSPAVLEENGAEKYPYLINQTQIDKAAKEGTDSANYWTYVRGFPPPSGVVNTVLTEGSCIAYGLYDTVTWAGLGRVRMMTLDPAYGGEDRCILKLWEAGMSDKNVYTVEFMESFELKIRVSDTMPPTHQIATQVKNYADLYGVRPAHFVVDESATQSCGDMIEELWKRGIIRVNFGGSPFTGVKSADSNLRCEDEYKNMVSCMYLQFAEYCRYGHIKNLDKSTARELCQRPVLEGKPAEIMKKKDFKKLVGRSPDHADSAVLLTLILRKSIGIIPGSAAMVQQLNTPRPVKPGHYDIDGSPDNYLNSSL